MQKFLSLIFVGLVLLTQTVSADTKASYADVKNYFVLSGFDELLDSMQDQIEASSKQEQLVAKDPESYRDFVRVFKATWDAEGLKQAAIEYIIENSTKTQIDALITWQKTSLARTMAAEEEIMREPDFQANFLRFIADLQSTPPSQETSMSIQRHVAAIDMGEMMVDMISEVSRSISKSVRNANPADDAKICAEIDREVEEMGRTLKPILEEQAILMSYYIYRNVSNTQLNQYTDFYETELGKIELQLSKQAFIHTIALWGSNFAEIFNDQRLNRGSEEQGI